MLYHEQPKRFWQFRAETRKRRNSAGLQLPIDLTLHFAFATASGSVLHRRQVCPTFAGSAGILPAQGLSAQELQVCPVRSEGHFALCTLHFAFATACGSVLHGGAGLSCTRRQVCPRKNWGLSAP